MLVVDDVNAMRVEIQKLLKSFGFESVYLASNGLEARQILTTEEIHFIVADWHMTPVDGLDLLKYVRASSSLKHLPFVMVTAESGRNEVIEAVKLGVDEYIVKPLTVEQIQNKVFNLLVKKKVLL